MGGSYEGVGKEVGKAVGWRLGGSWEGVGRRLGVGWEGGWEGWEAVGNKKVDRRLQRFSFFGQHTSTLLLVFEGSIDLTAFLQVNVRFTGHADDGGGGPIKGFRAQPPGKPVRMRINVI